MKFATQASRVGSLKDQLGRAHGSNRGDFGEVIVLDREFTDSEGLPIPRSQAVHACGTKTVGSMVQASVGMAAPKGLAFIAELAMKEPSVSLAAAGAAVSAPYIAYIIAPSTFVAHADSRQSATASTSGTNDPFSKVRPSHSQGGVGALHLLRWCADARRLRHPQSYVQSRSFWSTFAPDNLLKMALKK